MFTVNLLLLLLLQAAPKTDRTDQALDLIRQQKYEPAYQELTEIVKADPANQRALSYLAAMELQTGRLDDCQRHVNELLAKDAKNPDYRELNGQVLMARRDWQNAETEWRWIIGEHPNSDQAHMQLAAVLLQQDRFTEALAEVTRSLEISPKRGDTRSLRGNILASLNRMDDAALDWNIALVGEPNDTVALAGLAVYLRLRDPDQALTYAKRAVELTGERNIGPIRVLTVVYKARGENDKARALLERAVLRFPNNEALAAELNSVRGVPNAKPPTPATTSKLAPVPPPAASAKPAPPKVVADKPVPENPAPVKTASVPPVSKPAPSAPVSKPVISAPAPKLVAVAAPPATPDPALPPLALGGATLGTSLADLLPFERLPLPPVPEKDKVVAVLAPRASVNPKAKVPVKESVDIPPPELFWGRLPLSTISPAFVWANVPPPADPNSLGEAARRIRDQKKKP
jgi:tetratricopeptide (TPR) repeat protein